MLLVLAAINPARQVLARPVVCTTSLEAPVAIPTSGPALPVEITRCSPVERTDAMVDRRFYTWTAPFARGVDVIHQVTDLLGIAMGGPEGNRLMGFGFPDQTIVWDGSVLQNTTDALLEEQSKPIPWRTVDISSGFDSSLASEGEVISEAVMVELDLPPSETIGTPVRGLW
nr:occludin/ELL family protein [Synechococcus sp. UW140]